MSVESVARSLLIVLAALVAVAGPGAALAPGLGPTPQGSIAPGAAEALPQADDVVCSVLLVDMCQLATAGPCQLADVSLNRPPYAIIVLDPDGCIWEKIKQVLPPVGLPSYHDATEPKIPSSDEPDA